MRPLVLLSLFVATCPAATFEGFGAELPGGPHSGMVQELGVVYWEDQPEIPERHRKEDGERRNFFNVFRPEGVEERLPGIIMIHGGGFGGGHPDEYHDRNQAAQWLTSHGYVVFSLGYSLRNKQTRLYASIDARQAIRFIKKHADRWGVDPARLGAWGFSAGSMILTKLIEIPDGGTMRISSKNADGEKVREDVDADTGPLAESDISSTLRVMVFSSSHEVHPKNAMRAIAEADHPLPQAVLLYQAPGEKPWFEGRAPEDDPIRRAYESRGVVFDGYGVPGGKHCPKLRLEVERDGDTLPMRDVVFGFLEEHLKGEAEGRIRKSGCAGE